MNTSSLYRTARELETIDDTAAVRAPLAGRRILDPRRYTPSEVIAHLKAVHRATPIAELEKLLRSPDLSAAAELVLDDYTAVAGSTDFCVGPAPRAYAARVDPARYFSDMTVDDLPPHEREAYLRRGVVGGEIRLQHCQSGMYLHAVFDGHQLDRTVTSVETNWEAGFLNVEALSCPYSARLALPYRHLHIPQWSTWKADGDAVFGRSGWNSRYLGLGIGTELYRRAANIILTARWPAKGLFEGGQMLRASLHRSDPWRWESPACPRCGSASSSTRTIDWASAPSSDELLAAHL